jgi:mannose-1-phosphate guanylyltransferase
MDDDEDSRMVTRTLNGTCISAPATSRDQNSWAMVLAGGDGIRLRALTRRITGDDRPKQYCPILGNESLLAQTRRRVALVVAPERIVLMLTRTHERFYAALTAAVPPRLLVAQPANRGTGPAILYGLLRMAKMAPTASVAIVPSDHYVSDDAAFMAHVAAAFEAVRIRPELVILLGISPTYPEVAYGWIESAGPVLEPAAGALSFVRRFWEKPGPRLAETLLARGCLWNSFVMVARVASILALIESAAADLYHTLLGLWPVLNTSGEAAVVEALYAGLPVTNFSEQVLVSRPEDLAVLPVRGVTWSDLGEPGRVRAVLEGNAVRTDGVTASGAVVASMPSVV